MIYLKPDDHLKMVLNNTSFSISDHFLRVFFATKFEDNNKTKIREND